MENIDRIYRHGDVIIFKLKTKPDDIAPDQSLNSIILAYGEVTGHKHLLTGEIETFNKEDKRENDVFFQVKETSVLTHEEHNTMILEKGFYLKVNQVEYNPFEDMIQQVLD